MLARVDLRRLGRIFRAVREHMGLRQGDLSALSRVSQSGISRVERGIAETMSLADLDRIARALNIRLSVDAWWRGGELARLMDAGHAAIVEYIVGLLRAAGWQVLVEYTFNVFGERGSVDIVAWHAERRALLLVEVKTRIADLQEMLSTFARKLRLVPPLLAESEGWRPAVVGRLIVASGTTANRRVIAAHPSTFEATFPLHAHDARRWLRDPTGDLAAVWLVTPGVVGTRSSGAHRVRRAH
jgi:transcriptional regulator with XRE-family HTH domain